MPISRIETNSIASSQTLTTPIIATTMGVGGATPAGSGSGITFPAAQSASTDVNTLDDYEEGTFTPALGGSVTNPTATYSAAYTYGKYIKVGKLVYISLEVRTSALSGGSGVLLITNMPFSRESTLYEPVLGLSLYNVAFDTSALLDVEFWAPTSLYVRLSNNASTSTEMQVSAWSSSSLALIRVSGCYQAAS